MRYIATQSAKQIAATRFYCRGTRNETVSGVSVNSRETLDFLFSNFHDLVMGLYDVAQTFDWQQHFFLDCFISVA